MNKSGPSKPTRACVVLGVLLLSAGPIAQHAWADQNVENGNVKNLLDQARTQAEQLDRDANTMTGLVRSDVTWQLHEDELARVKTHVDDLGKLVAELQSSRVDASPWQKDAIDRVVPLLREVAANTTKEINWMNKNQDRRPTSLKYDRWVNQNATAAHELSQLISDTVQYGEDRGKLASLSDDLGMNTSSASQ
jgi:hypothetical protein